MTDEPFEEKRSYCKKYCADHENLKGTIIRSVPRWVFVAALSAAIVMSSGFAFLQRQAMKETSYELKLRMTEVEKHIAERMQDLRMQYTEDVRRFYDAVDQNRVILQSVDDELRLVQIEQSKIRELQNIVLEKLNLAGP